MTLELLLASEAHQGHVTSLWNPANARYIHGIRQGVHIISLEVTAAHLRRSAKVVQEVARRGGIILFVGTREGQDRAVARAAELAKGYHLFERWIPGSITNGQQILGRCKTKVVNELDEEVTGFVEQLYDRPALRPDLVVCFCPLPSLEGGQYFFVSLCSRRRRRRALHSICADPRLVRGRPSLYKGLRDL